MFTATALNPEHVFSIVSLNSILPTIINIYQSNRLQIASIIVEITLTNVFVNYANFADLFYLDLASKFSKHI